MKKPYLLIILAVAVALLSGALIWGGLAWYNRNLRPPQSGDSTAQLIRIEEGESSVKVAETLHSKGVIRNPWAFRLYLRLHSLSGGLQAGLYRLNPGQSAPDIARILASGETAVRGLTIIGGMRLSEITDKLKQLDYQDADIQTALSANYDYSVLKDRPSGATLEGYLLPETYVIELETPLPQLMDLILRTTESTITPEMRQRWAARGLNIHQGLTLASIVEKEAAKPEDQRQIAQVFYKRLAIARKLEADPTFEYGAALLGVEPSLSLDSPYNTYLYEGLPPAPIAAVGMSALEAVANPAATDWLYFVSDKEGNTYFTDDEEKHKQNTDKYLH